jgi:transcriptional regulator with XRE-family HTH domain
MNLGEKIKHLREVEGELRGLNRPMTQTEVVRAMQEELHESISQAYLSQLEANKRVHLTASSRDLLSRFFKVHPGYLVSDPPDFSTDLLTDVEQVGDRLNTWLVASAEEWHSESALYDLFIQLAESMEPRRYIALFRDLMSLPIGELENLTQVLMSEDRGEHELE